MEHPVAEIDSALHKQIEDLLTAYKNFHDKHFMNKTQDIGQEPKEDELKLLEELLKTVPIQLVKSLQNLIPEVRALVKPSSDLSDLINQYQESCFSVQNLELCLETIQSTYKTLNQIINLAEAKKLTKKKADDQVSFLLPIIYNKACS